MDTETSTPAAFVIMDYPGAALRYPEHFGTEWERRKQREQPESRFGPFADEAKYDLVKWAIESGQSLASVNGLLRTKYVSGRQDSL